MSEKLNEEIALRVRPQLREAIESAANQERRPMSNLIRCILEDWVRSRHSSKAGTGAGAIAP
jgi:hypothetical protein